jgi:hypothetical protein
MIQFDVDGAVAFRDILEYAEEREANILINTPDVSHDCREWAVTVVMRGEEISYEGYDLNHIFKSLAKVLKDRCNPNVPASNQVAKSTNKAPHASIPYDGVAIACKCGIGRDHLISGAVIKIPNWLKG